MAATGIEVSGAAGRGCAVGGGGDGGGSALHSDF